MSKIVDMTRSRCASNKETCANIPGIKSPKCSLSSGPRTSTPMPQISSDVAQIVGLFVECIFYGLYLATFAASLQSIASSRPELSWVSRFKHQCSMLIIILLLFIFSTLNLILGLIRIIAFIRRDLVGVSASDWLNIVKVFTPIIHFWLVSHCSQPLCVNLQTMVADCVLVSLRPHDKTFWVHIFSPDLPMLDHLLQVSAGCDLAYHSLPRRIGLHDREYGNAGNSSSQQSISRPKRQSPVIIHHRVLDCNHFVEHLRNVCVYLPIPSRLCGY